MKLNNKFTHSCIILLCLALGVGPCTAHDSNDVPNMETTTQADPPESEVPEFSFAPSGLPDEIPTSSEESSSHSYTSFSAAFADILKGTLRGNSLTMPDHIEHTNHHIGVKQICSHTDYPDMCLSTIAPFVGRHFDLMNILEAAIKACSYQTNFTMSRVMAHMEKSPEMAAALADCKEQYRDAMENLHRAMEAIPSRDLGTITVMLSAVMADVSACEGGFQDLQSPSPLTNSEGLVTITASNCLSIASLIPY